MEAGSELNVLIAEKVMKWKRIEREQPENRGFAMTTLDLTHWITSTGSALFFLPAFSVNISDAWEVVEEMEKNEFHFFIESCKPIYSWWAQFVPHNGDDEINSEAPTAPLAICRCALKVALKSSRE